ncbi:MAG: hypothetical protein EBU90_25840 [Proteobacteria bacterium]|nr:hypothetical protein [Pseudomonadota bacterium]NBP16444.1 hypothetical protein [bacterium]
MHYKILLSLFFLSTTLNCQQHLPPIAGGLPVIPEIFDAAEAARLARQEEAKKEMLKQGHRAAGLALLAAGCGALAIGDHNNQLIQSIADLALFCGFGFLGASNDNRPLQTTGKEIIAKWASCKVAILALEEATPYLPDFNFSALLTGSWIEQWGPNNVAIGVLAAAKIAGTYNLSQSLIVDPFLGSLCSSQLAGLLPLPLTRAFLVQIILFPKFSEFLYNRIHGTRPT